MQRIHYAGEVLLTGTDIADAIVDYAAALAAKRSAASVEIHWAHRVAAFLLLVIAGGATRVAMRGGPRNVARAAGTSFALIVLQLVVAAVLVLSELPQSLQAAHLAVGAAVWFGLAVWASLARQHARASLDPTRASG